MPKIFKSPGHDHFHKYSQGIGPAPPKGDKFVHGASVRLDFLLHHVLAAVPGTVKPELLEVVLAVQVVHELHEFVGLLLVADPNDDVHELPLQRGAALGAPEQLEQDHLRDADALLADLLALERVQLRQLRGVRLRELTELEQLQHDRASDFPVPDFSAEFLDYFTRFHQRAVLRALDFAKLVVQRVVLDPDAREQVVEAVVPARLRKLRKFLPLALLAKVRLVFGLFLVRRRVDAHRLGAKLQHSVRGAYLVVHYLYLVVVVVVDRSEHEAGRVLGAHHYRHLCHAVQSHHDLGVHEHQPAVEHRQVEVVDEKVHVRVMLRNYQAAPRVFHERRRIVKHLVKLHVRRPLTLR